TPSFLLLDQGSLQINPAASVWLDVDELQQRLTASQTHSHADLETCETCIQHLETGVAFYRGDFLDGLLFCDSGDFETWALVRREQLRLQVLTAFYHLANYYIRQGQYAQAQTYAFRQVEIEPYCEEAYRQLMYILVRSGQRSAALAKYETCRCILAAELGVTPTQETQDLYDHIRFADQTQHPDNLAMIACGLGNLMEARELLVESLACKKALGNRNAILHSLLEIGAIDIAIGMYTEAHGYFHEALLLAQESSAANLMFCTLVNQAELYINQGEVECAVALMTLALLQEGVGLELTTKAKRILSELKTALPVQILAPCQGQAQTRTLEEVVIEILAGLPKTPNVRIP
ncbi:MAG: bacterial transcriptional activator domain-containing protein, partial [Deltaproteobacteria bacterium]|nr:bacterial transcriptional activator domain-containing protein [Deltaproteobacteria bacterium]